MTINLTIDFNDPQFAAYLALSNADGSPSKAIEQKHLCLKALLKKRLYLEADKVHTFTNAQGITYNVTLRQGVLPRGNNPQGMPRFIILEKAIGQGHQATGYLVTRGLVINGNRVHLKNRDTENRWRLLKLFNPIAFTNITDPNQKLKLAKVRKLRAHEAEANQHLSGSKTAKSLAHTKTLSSFFDYILMAYYPKVNLETYIESPSYPRCPIARLKIIESILYELMVLHNKGYIHADIKPDNVRYDPRTGAVKIIDYTFTGKVDTQLELNTLGTPEYAAPYIMSNQGEPLFYRPIIDIYSAALSMLEIWEGKLLPALPSTTPNYNPYNRHATYKQAALVIVQESSHPLHTLIYQAMDENCSMDGSRLYHQFEQAALEILAQLDFSSKYNFLKNRFGPIIIPHLDTLLENEPDSCLALERKQLQDNLKKLDGIRLDGGINLHQKLSAYEIVDAVHQACTKTYGTNLEEYLANIEGLIGTASEQAKRHQI